MINVLYIEKGLGKGGSALSLKYLLDAIDPSSYRPVLLFNDRNADPRGIDWGGVETLVSAPAGTSSGIFRLFTEVLPEARSILRIIRERRVALVHLNNDIDSHLGGILACRLARVPFVCHLRTTRRLTKIEKVFAKLADYFIVLSREAKVFFTGQGIPAGKITVSYDPFKTELPPAGSVPEWLARVNGRQKIGICSRVARGKGHDVFLSAAAKIVKKIPTAHFFIVGDEAADNPGYRAQLEQQAGKLGISESVTFTGWQPDILGVMSRLDVVVDASSLPEGLRRTLVEAMIAGKPVVATDVGITREILEESAAGICVLKESPDDLADKLLPLLGDGRLREEMGRKGRAFALKHFDMREKAREIGGLYENVLQKAGKRG